MGTKNISSELYGVVGYNFEYNSKQGVQYAIECRIKLEEEANLEKELNDILTNDPLGILG